MNHAVYILSNCRNTVLYIGRTGNLIKRVRIHKERCNKHSFSYRFGTDKLVYYEFHNTWDESYKRERQMKKWRREWKEKLIHYNNPEWRDLSDSIY